MIGSAIRSRLAAAVLTIATAVALAAPVAAQEVAPDQLALARKYVDLTDRSAIFEVTLVETGVETMRTLVAQNPEMIDPVNVAVETVLGKYKERKSELLDQFARIYAVRFTPEELQQIVAFYESPAGTKLAAANSEINNDLRRVLQVFETNLKTEFFAAVRSELRAAGVNL